MTYTEHLMAITLSLYFMDLIDSLLYHVSLCLQERE